MTILAQQRLAAVCTLAFIVLAPGPARAQVPTYGAFYRADLTAAQFVPPNTWSSKGFVSLAVAQSGSSITVTMLATGFGFMASPVHIHGPAAPGVVGPVVFTLNLCGGFPNFSCTQTVAVTPAQLADLRGGLWYIDVHVQDPSESIRGQVRPDAPSIANHSAAQVVGGSTSTATGFSWFTLSADGAWMAQWHSLTGYFANITSVHFHAAARGDTGAQWFVIPSSGGLGLSTVTIGTTPMFVASMLRSGVGYVDVHTTQFPGGETRGQVNTPNEVTDVEADGAAEIGVFRPATGTWYLQNTRSLAFHGQAFGAAGDQVTPGDFDGDGKTDRAVWRDSGGLGTFYVWRSATATLQVQPFGQTGDVPLVVADWDGDGKADFAVWRSGIFYILQSSDGTLRVQNWGVGGIDTPIIGDWDGDRRNDAAVYRLPEGRFYVLATSLGLIALPFGSYATDAIVPGDYDADGKTDFAVWRGTAAGTNGVWYILQSLIGTLRVTQFGAGGPAPLGDLPVPADYDGDGYIDVAVVRRTSGTFVWYILATNSDPRVFLFGIDSDAPIQRYLVR